MRLVIVLVPLALAACNFAAPDIADVPDQPTFEQDVKPLFDDHCNLCHGTSPDRGAPSSFRLDAYDDTPGKRGAASMAGRAVHAVEGDSMPPAAAWGDGVGPNGKKMLQRWIDQGAPKTR